MMSMALKNGQVEVAGRTVTRAEVEEVLYHEATILDTWRYDDWLALFEEGAHYEVPTSDNTGLSTLESGSFVMDDYALIKARVKRLKSRKAHAENPPSRTHRMVSNVRLEASADGTLIAHANFIIHRARDGEFNAYIGRYQHELVLTNDGFKFRNRQIGRAHV